MIPETKEKKFNYTKTNTLSGDIKKYLTISNAGRVSRRNWRRKKIIVRV